MSSLLKNSFRNLSINPISLRYPILYLLVVLELGIYIYFFSEDSIVYFDSFQYIDASYLLSKGQLDVWRTPVMPLVLFLCRLIFGESVQFVWFILVVSISFLISVYYFQKLLSCYYSNFPRIIFYLTAFYGLFPGFSGFCAQILSEGLTISFLVFFLYSSVYIGKKGFPSISNVIWSAFWLFLMIYLRPVMLCIIPVWFFYWIWILVKWKKSVRLLLTVGLCFVTIIGSLVLYIGEMNRLYGLHTISQVSTINNYYLARENSLITGEDTTDKEFASFLDSVSQKSARHHTEVDWREFGYIKDSLKVHPRVFEEAVNNALSKDWFAFIRPVPKKLSLANYTTAFFPPPIPKGDLLLALLPIPIFFYFLTMIVTLAWLIKTRCDIRWWLCWLFSASVAFASIVGAPWDWGRLFTPAMPPIIVVVGGLLSWMRTHFRYVP